MMIDAGATNSALNVSSIPKPDASGRPGAWIARYAQRHLRATGRQQPVCPPVTQIRPDHPGRVSDDLPMSQQGAYRLSGVTTQPTGRQAAAAVVRC